MKAETRNTLLKLAYLAALGSLYSAVAILFKCVAFDGLVAPFELLSTVIFIFAGYAAALLINRFIASEKTLTLIPVSGIIPAAAVILAYSAYGSTRTTVEMVLVEAVYFAGAWAYFKNYGEIATPRWTMPPIIATVIGLILAVVRDSSSYAKYKPAVFFYIYLFVILSVILENQKYIDYIMTEMAGQTPRLPLHIRKFNLLVMLVASLTITLIAFAGPVIGFVRAFFGNLGRFAGFVLKKIFNLLFSPGGNSVKNPPEVPEPGIQKHIEPLEDQGLDERIVIAVLAVLGVIILFVIVRKLPQVFREVKRSLARLISIIRAKLAALNRERLVTSVFNDEVEFSRAVFVDEVLSEYADKGRVRRNFPRRDPALQVRYYYGVVLDLFAAAKISILKSDTTGEIYKKAEHLDGVDEPLGQLTGIYNKVRYGEHVPDPEEVEKAGEGCRLIKSALSSSTGKKKPSRDRKAD